MNQYHVTVTSDGVYSAIKSDHCRTTSEVDELCNYENWFGCDAEDESDAIAQAKAQNFSYVSKEQVAKLVVEADNLMLKNKEFVL